MKHLTLKCVHSEFRNSTCSQPCCPRTEEYQHDRRRVCCVFWKSLIWFMIKHWHNVQLSVLWGCCRCCRSPSTDALPHWWIMKHQPSISVPTHWLCCSHYTATNAITFCSLQLTIIQSVDLICNRHSPISCQIVLKEDRLIDCI